MTYNQLQFFHLKARAEHLLSHLVDPQIYSAQKHYNFLRIQ